MDIASTWWNYHQHSLCCLLLWRDIISTQGYYRAFGNVQYHGEVSSPLGGTLSVLQKVLITLEGEIDDIKTSKCPSVAFMIFLCGTAGISGTSQEALLYFDDGGVLWLFGFDTDRMQLTEQV